MKTNITLLLIILAISACNKTNESTQNGINDTLEKLVESQTGEQVDLAEVGSFENNTVKASFLMNGQEKITSKTNMIGSILSSKDADGKLLSFQFQDEEGTMIMVVISKFPDSFSLPFTTQMFLPDETPENTPSATLTFIKASELGMISYMSFNGTITINELNIKKASLSLKGKAGDAADLETPQNWKDFKADFYITSPIIQTMGIEKSEILK